MKKLRVLLITRECLRADSNEGNVLLNLFGGQPVECANIYCKPGVPDNDLCAGRYFQLTDRMALENILHRTPMGCIVAPEIAAQDSGDAAAGKSAVPAAEAENKKFYDFFRGHNWEIFHLARELLWQAADFKSGALQQFIKDFAPDIVFAPLCYSRFVLAVQRYAIRLAGVPAVTYIYDDLYSLRQLRFSPLFWLNRFALRSAIRKTLALHSFAYTMTQQQAQEYSRMLAVPMQVLRKCASVKPVQPVPHEGVRLVYAGGIYYGRDDTLAAVADAVRILRAQGQDVRLDIYTASPLRRKTAPRLHDGDGCTVHPPVPAQQLRRIYAAADIALHVESFRKKNALVTRLSFSAKIVDCLSGGCAVLAVCPSLNAGWQYLRDEDAAVCVCDTAGVAAAVTSLVQDAALREQYRCKAAQVLQKNHEETAVRAGLLAQLTELAAKR